MLPQSGEDVAAEKRRCPLEQKAAARLNGAVQGEGRFGLYKEEEGRDITGSSSQTV